MTKLWSNRLHLGCGTCQPENWINVDGSWNAWLASHPRLKLIVRLLNRSLKLVPPAQLDLPWTANVVFHDLRKPLPFEAESMSVIYSSHTLEHLYRSEAEMLLDECYRVLRRGGIIRLVVPDLLSLAKRYVDARISFSVMQQANERPADAFMRQLLIWPPEPLKIGSNLYRLYQVLTDFHRHKWMYDADSLICLLKAHGFEHAEELGYLESRIQGIEEVELASRVLNDAGVCVEADKP